MKTLNISRNGLQRAARYLPLLALIMLCAAGPGNDGIGQLKKIYSRMNSTEFQVARLNYTVRTTLRKTPAMPENQRVSTSTIDLVVSKEQARFTSKELIAYEDKTNSFTVIPSTKTVYWSDSNMGKNKKDKMKRMSVIQDTLLDMCTVAENKEVKGHAEYDRLIVLQPNKEAAGILQAEKISFYISSTGQSIYKVTIEGTKEAQAESIEITYNNIDFNYEQEDIGKPVRNFFVQGKDQLAPAYKGYKLVDNRKK